MWPASGDSGPIKARVRDDDGREREGRRGREREKAGWTSLSANLSKSHVRWCAHPRTRTERGKERERDRERERKKERVSEWVRGREKEARTRACAVHYTRAMLAGQRWRTGQAKSVFSLLTSSVRMSSVIDYAQRRERCDSLNLFVVPPFSRIFSHHNYIIIKY